MRSVSLLPLSLLLAACGGGYGTAQLINDPQDATNAIITNVAVTDEGCTPLTIVVESDSKALLRFINGGGTHFVYSESLSLHTTLEGNDVQDVIIPTGLDGKFDLLCGVPQGTAVEGAVMVGD